MGDKCKEFSPWIMVVAALLLLSTTASADTIYVPGDYDQIQDAINNACCNDVILVDPGTYRESIAVAGITNLTIRANGPAGTVIIDALGADTAVLINADEATFEGFVVKNFSSVGIYTNGSGNEITGNDVQVSRDVELNKGQAHPTAPFPLRQDPKLNIFTSLDGLYDVVGQIVGDTNEKEYHGNGANDGYLEIFGILSYGPAVQITDNEVNVSGKITRYVKPSQNRIAAYVVGIAALEAGSIETVPSEVHANTITVNGDMRIIPNATHSAENGNPAILGLGIFASGADAEVTDNTISVTGYVLINRNDNFPKFLGESFALGIWARTPGGNISGNTIDADNQVATDNSGTQGHSGAWSIGMIPQSSGDALISSNDIQVRADSTSGPLGENIASPGPNSGNAYGIGIGIFVPYETNFIVDNVIAGTGTASVSNAPSSAFELGIGVLVLDERLEEVTNDLPESLNRVNFNDLADSEYGLYAFSENDLPALDVDATLNWWGACNGPGGWGPGDGAMVYGTHDFVPWLDIESTAHAFYGTVTYENGTDVPGDMVLAAADGKSGWIYFEDGIYGSANACENRLEIAGASEGSRIIFYVNGVEANEDATFTPGMVSQRNLTIPEDGEVTYPPPDDTPSPPPGGRGGGGDGKERIIHRASDSSGSGATAGGGGITLPPAAEPDPTITGEEAPPKGKPGFLNAFKWWLLLLIIAVALIAYYNHLRKTE